MRIDIAVRRLQSHHEAPALAGVRRPRAGQRRGRERAWRGVPGRVGRGRGAGLVVGAPPASAALGIPGERDPIGRVCDRRVGGDGGSGAVHDGRRHHPMRRLDRQREARAALAVLRQADHHAHHLQVAPFQGGVERARGLSRGAPAGGPGTGQRGQGQHQAGRQPGGADAAWPAPRHRPGQQAGQPRHRERAIGRAKPFQPRARPASSLSIDMASPRRRIASAAGAPVRPDGRHRDRREAAAPGRHRMPAAAAAHAHPVPGPPARSGG